MKRDIYSITKPKLQLTLDHQSFQKSVKLASQVGSSVDIIAIGKSFIQRQRKPLTLIRELKNQFPDQQLSVEITTPEDAESFFNAGADICNVTNQASPQLISRVVAVANKCGRKVEVDLNTGNRVTHAIEFAKRGVHILGVGTRGAGTDQFVDVAAIANQKLDVQISVKGIDIISNALPPKQIGADIIVVSARDALSKGASIDHVAQKIRSLTSTESKTFRGSDPTGFEIDSWLDSDVEPALLVKLQGEQTRGRAVQMNSDCELSVKLGLLDREDVLTEVSGKIFKEAIKSHLEVIFQLYCRPFVVTDGNSRIKTKFVEKGFEEQVTFHLRAPAEPYEYLTITMEMQIHGIPVVRIPIELSVAGNIDSTLFDGLAPLIPQKLDLEQLIEVSKEPPPKAVLAINTTEHSADLIIIDNPPTISGGSNALSQEGIAKRCDALTVAMKGIAEHSVWLDLKEPLTPDDETLQLLSEPLHNVLARVAEAGYNLYAWLANTAGMGNIVERIDRLPVDSRVIIRTDNLSIPWEIIYPEPFYADEIESKVDVAKFWGYRFVFESSLSPGNKPLPTGNVHTDPKKKHKSAQSKLTALFNSDIDNEKKEWKAGKPVSYQREIFGKSFTNGKLEIIEECEDARKLVRRQKNFSPFIYFYCHGQSAKQLELKQGCRITTDDVKHEKTFENAPIVFLNACSSAAMVSISFDDFSSLFLCKGALGLITSTFSVPTPFAARFGCELVIRYMKGDADLGDILLALRRESLNHSIPIGLFYVLQCTPSVRRDKLLEGDKI